MSTSSLINGPHVYNGFLPGMLCQIVPKYLRHGYMYPCNVCDDLFSYHSHISVCLLFSMHTFTNIISAGSKWHSPYACSGMQLAVFWLSYLVT